MRGRSDIVVLATLLFAVIGCERAPHSPPSQPRSQSGASREPTPRPARPAPAGDPVAGLPTPAQRGEGFHRGVSLGLFVSSRDEATRRRHYGRFLDEITDVGATDLQLVVQWGMADVRASEVRPLPGRSTDDGELIWVIDAARARGLRVFLMPILDLERRAPGDWRGKIAPTDWDAWWASYAAYILRYARLSQQRDVSMLSVGSELVSTESQQARWRALIANVRAVYDGQLTYSANWDHFEPVPFWDALDVAGMTAYRTLSEAREPTEDELVQGFAAMRAAIDSWANRADRRFLFTEIGYASQVGAARDPWDYRPRPGGPDPGLQLRCYRAMLRAWHDHPRFDGLYVWNWFGRGGVSDIGYSPRGKPAAEVLRHWYGAGVGPATQ